MSNPNFNIPGSDIMFVILNDIKFSDQFSILTVQFLSNYILFFSNSNCAIYTKGENISNLEYFRISTNIDSIVVITQINAQYNFAIYNKSSKQLYYFDSNFSKTSKNGQNNYYSLKNFFLKSFEIDLDFSFLYQNLGILEFNF